MNKLNKSKPWLLSKQNSLMTNNVFLHIKPSIIKFVIENEMYKTVITNYFIVQKINADLRCFI